MLGFLLYISDECNHPKIIEIYNRYHDDMYLSIDPMMVHNDTVIIDSTYMLPEETSNTLYEYCMNKMTINVSIAMLL